MNDDFIISVITSDGDRYDFPVADDKPKKKRAKKKAKVKTKDAK